MSNQGYSEESTVSGVTQSDVFHLMINIQSYEQIPYNTELYHIISYSDPGPGNAASETTCSHAWPAEHPSTIGLHVQRLYIVTYHLAVHALGAFDKRYYSGSVVPGIATGGERGELTIF